MARITHCPMVAVFLCGQSLLLVTTTSCSSVEDKTPIGSSELAGNGSAEEAPSEPLPHSHQLELQSQAQALLSTEERSLIEQRLLAEGIPLSELTFAGRLILWNDVYLDADSILPVVEKGRTLTHVDASFAPVLYSRTLDANNNSCTQGTIRCMYQFWLPQVANVWVLPNNSPSFLKPLFQNALNAISAAANNCIAGDQSGAVLTQQEWAQIGSGQPFVNHTDVAYGPISTVCPGLPNSNACSYFPGMHTTSTPFHLAFGRYIGLGAAFVTGTDAVSQYFVTHEILHTMGVAHPFDDGGAKLRVPGTSALASDQLVSIMQNFCYPCYNHEVLDLASPDCNRDLACNLTFTPSADDRATLATLYASQPGSGCGSVGFQTTCQPNYQATSPCTKISSTSLSGDCCFCGGVTRSYVKAAWNNSTFLCQ
jgi:hypothetical protein